MSDQLSGERLITYCETHSETDLALFHSDHVAELLHMAGHHDRAKTWEGQDTFRSLDLRDLCKEARVRLSAPTVGQRP
jgi:hypothetical protein